MPSFLHSFATAVPPHRHEQAALGSEYASWFDDKRIQRLISKASASSGIDHRHLVVPGFSEVGPFDQQGEAPTSRRNATYAAESRILARRAAETLFEQPGAPTREEITHVVFVSCTGFVNPGPDFHLVHDLALPAQTERYLIGFMGCYGAFPALRMAAQFCEASAAAKVLVVCLELCSLHMQREGTTDAILGNTVFADGAAAAIVSSKPVDGSSFELSSFASAVIPESESEMAWGIGDRGFDLALSSYVPKVISAEIEEVLHRCGYDRSAIDHFAVHPGGKAILDRVAQSLALPDNALDASRSILRRYGNMSSPTILFVLKEMLDSTASGEETLAIAFGPGLTVESGLLVKR